MSKTTTESLDNQQAAIEQDSEQIKDTTANVERQSEEAASYEQETDASAVEQTEDGHENGGHASEDIDETLASLVADGEVFLTADSIDELTEKFKKFKTAAFDKKLAAGAISHDIDNEVYVLQVNAIN